MGVFCTGALLQAINQKVTLLKELQNGLFSYSSILLAPTAVSLEVSRKQEVVQGSVMNSKN